MFVTLAGILTLVRLVQVSNAEFPILVTFVPRATLVRLRQRENAELSMLVTVSGIVTLTTLKLPWNAINPTLVTGMPSIEAGIVTVPPGPVYLVMVIEPLLVM
jgi:hypothetical protein